MSNHTVLTRGRSGEICVPLEATSAEAADPSESPLVPELEPLSSSGAPALSPRAAAALSASPAGELTARSLSVRHVADAFLFVLRELIVTAVLRQRVVQGRGAVTVVAAPELSRVERDCATASGGLQLEWSAGAARFITLFQRLTLASVRLSGGDRDVGCRVHVLVAASPADRCRDALHTALFLSRAAVSAQLECGEGAAAIGRRGQALVVGGERLLLGPYVTERGDGRNEEAAAAKASDTLHIAPARDHLSHKGGSV
eukprot:CAMPEP_0177270522 /NCGR_PEP_ID=MMETSP0367-20130122/65010_1 /TAXON_ID=447022 ORGANISM="Scrippsiella hangoei-like, Strain SHHI-4" /NCGR_SAMPLE_ID=MMETSP0367 /ASSEMBLY_ACC=CAM_ASM_000362 /LENGTH=257 /DNA_ID=CAMNT_0018726459 /DNA_START=149 /DNA_END=918 /DNA_ORIENTATION=-